MVANGNGRVNRVGGADGGADLLQVVGCSQHDSWGASAGNSLSARLHALCAGTTSATASATSASSAVENDGIVSSFALGTHTDAHTVLAEDTTRSLLDYIRTEVIEVDSGKVEHYARLHRHGLPFVLRVLSIETPQAIHVHPDGADAARLHASNAAAWPDSIGRAEMALAVTTVDALFGFRPVAGVVAELARVPEFADAVGRPATDAFVHAVKTGRGGVAALRAVFTSFMTAHETHVKDCLDAVVDRFHRMPNGSLTDTDTLLLKVHQLHEHDTMCFAVYFLNRVKLNPGEAVFIHPREPHAYLSGDLVEVSSSSANVARAGLTALQKDQLEFVNMLNYDDSPVEVSTGEKRDEYVTEFVPPVDEFMVTKYDVPQGKEQALDVAM